MGVLQETSRKLVLESGSRLNHTTLTLDKADGRARIERMVLMLRRNIQDVALSDITDVSVATVKDAASGADLHLALMHLKSGGSLALPSSGDDAEATVERVRGFLGLDH